MMQPTGVQHHAATAGTGQLLAQWNERMGFERCIEKRGNAQEKKRRMYTAVDRFRKL